jgi:hypothetical protein
MQLNRRALLLQDANYVVSVSLTKECPPSICNDPELLAISVSARLQSGPIETQVSGLFVLLHHRYYFPNSNFANLPASALLDPNSFVVIA